MKAGTPQNDDPRWGAATPLTAGILALLGFSVFVGFWATRTLVPGTFPAAGTLVMQTDEDPNSNRPDEPLHVTARLDAAFADRVFGGQPALLTLRYAHGGPPMEVPATVTRIAMNGGGVVVEIVPTTRESLQSDGFSLVNGSPVEVVLSTGDRTPLALLLDPVTTHFPG
ncbi:hypothetical protein AAFO92_20830 [Roseovarius sp. CAU 1744]|uniref:hypothetical protein n=1 Tax=Roseovarius sp. CAU 1744 TaxID=3140368 RepID=UPI00325C1451